MNVFIPYSHRSFDGIVTDARRRYGDTIEITAIVLEGETPPANCRHLPAASSGTPGLIALQSGWRAVVIANGGPTPLTVAAVLLAQRLGCPLMNLQPDGAVEMETDPSF